MKMDKDLVINEKGKIMMPVLETFLSCNGEGLDVGKPVTFVRLVGCNLRCKYGAGGVCDTPESLLFPCQRKVKDFEYMTAKQVATIILDNGAPRVTLTGGEPLARPGIGQWLEELIEELDYKVLIEIETNGSIDIAEHVLDKFKSLEALQCLRFTMDYKSKSSAMNALMNLENWDYLAENDVIKCVVGSVEDMEDAIAKFEEYQPTAQIIFSPMFEVIDPVVIWEFIQRPEVLKWDIKFQLQLHKFVYDPAVTGV